MLDLFDHKLVQKRGDFAPLADKMRPTTFDDFVGQKKVVGPGTMLRNAIEKDQIPSIIFWGPPGAGKTTLARIIAEATNSNFVKFSAVTSGVKELREVIAQTKERLKFKSQRTILFIDEIHRWSKSQQDALLPYVEDGTVVLIGATTENPSFEVISALLSRSRVFVLEQLTEKDLKTIIARAIKHGFEKIEIKIAEDDVAFLAKMANGDARVALNALEFAVKSDGGNKGVITIDQNAIKEALQKSHMLYDKTGEQHYNIISALHKSLRGSDPDASLYWLGRMLEAGEKPEYVARRLVRFASEDIGMADPNALTQAVAAYQACHFIGMPECDVILAQAVVYLAKAPKSNALYSAYKQVQEDVKTSLDEPVPLHLRNAPTKLMKNLGYGKNYKYNPNYEPDDEEVLGQEYLPEKLVGKIYYED
ncbi:MAG: AAA family ATPase [Candidatus Buchananbacteria bacterium CG10_big_fil_rev_8_21_14_0_10_42_9]|uniref:AAA family ATPase n=1 Tax=Candidatus Buchananbacteria bacterium CG10_big_fil_rev_8_21_14_0_10_42_9 TaxID=1974526 RepID=A0A2H0W0F1_9BACT|nr:MAG: AAA family ATPase [Candidatus Buchananbacteria bacterium CG10_big_fil_rev_8_21_14_0_10_42_9]